MAELRLIEKADAEAVAQQAALMVKTHLQEQPGSPIIFPTGKTPRRLYELLGSDKSLDWSQAQLFHLDDYVPPANQSTQSSPYQSFQDAINQELWDAIGGEKHYFINDVKNPSRYEERIMQAGGPGLVLLGIGGNGHVAFNEPPCPVDSSTREVPLCPTTLKANFVLDAPQAEYPQAAVTLGLDVILKAKSVILMATGEKKRDIIRHAFDPDQPPNEDCPASWLKTHPNVTVLCDFSVF